MFELSLPTVAAIAIRPTAPADLDGIARVSVDTWRQTYGGLLPDSVLERLRYNHQEDRHRRFLGEPATQHFVAVEPLTGEVVGFANGGPSRQPRLGFDGEVYELYVQNGFQMRGVGRALFDAVRGELAAGGRIRLLVWVLAGNPNRPFYESLGGEVVARQPIRLGGAELEEVGYGWTL